MKIIVVTPEKQVLERDVVSVTLPGRAGQLTVLNGHDLLVTELSAGRLFFRWNDAEGKPQRDDYIVSDGIAEVTKDAARVFVAVAEHAQ